jgi:demethylmenaquinone methyltransferase/2-methoxy-6-polyprenyl-1,4-benzoquinol methylase
MTNLTQRPGPLPPPESKRAWVQDMFSRIASRYDLMNRLMTLGRDHAWRRFTVEQSNVEPGGWVLDVATGTGDLALEVLRQAPDAHAVGLDFTPEMLALVREKVEESTASGIGDTGRGPLLVAGDALSLPYRDGAFDSVVTGFALRNVTSIPQALAEMARVTRPGGRLGCLEIAKPRLPLFRRLFAIYFYRFVPLLGGWITGQPSAYTYLPHSLSEFLTPDELADVMRQTGWNEVRLWRLMLGTVAVHVGVRG